MNYTDLDLTVLKGILSNKKNAVDFLSNCDSDVFSPDVGRFAKLITSYIQTYKEPPTLNILEDQLKKGKNTTLLDYSVNLWNKIASTPYVEKEFGYNLDKIKKKRAETILSSLKENLAKAGDNGDIDKQLQDMQRATQSIKALKNKKSYERKTIQDAVPEFIEEFKAKALDPNFDAGIKTGYSYLDSVTDGLRGGELLLVGAESGGGKSMLLMNMATQIWMGKNTIDMRDNFTPGHNVMYFSLEMPFKPCRNRLLSRLSGVPSKKIRNAKVSKEESAKLSSAVKFAQAYPNQFEIIDIARGVTMETVEMMYEDAKMNFIPDVVVIDYLGLMDYDEADLDDWLKLGKISEKIHEFARVHNVIVLSAVQLNRAKGKEIEDRIGMHRIGRSSLIMQNANIAIQIETRQNEKNYPDMYYHLIKNRDGELGKGKLIKNLACGTLLDDPIIEEVAGFEFKDVDDISDAVNLLEI